MYTTDRTLLTRLLSMPPHTHAATAPHTADPVTRTDTPAPPLARHALLTVAAFLVVYLALTTLGASLWLALVGALAVPVLLAWWVLCGVLETHEPALNALLDERRATLHETAQALRKGGTQ